MPKIEISTWGRENLLYINDLKINHEDYSITPFTSGYAIEMTHLEDYEFVMSCYPSDFSNINTFTFMVKQDPEDFRGFYLNLIHLDFLEMKAFLVFRTNVEEWVYPWKITDQVDGFSILFEDEFEDDRFYDSMGVYADEFDIIRHKFIGEGFTIGEIISEVKDRTREIQKLISKTPPTSSASVQIEFDFPEEVRVACEQYLVYFSQFLKDVGVESITSLNENSNGTVIFTVTPKDQRHALEAIRDALTMYLNLPSMPMQVHMTPHGELNIQRLQAQVMHLNSQLMFANAILQQKDNIISDQKGMINQNLITIDVLTDAVKRADENDVEAIVGNIVKIKKFDWQIIEIDLPEIVRKFKKLFSSDDNPEDQ